MLSPARSQRVLGARDITKVLNFDQKESSLCYNIGLEAKVAKKQTKKKRSFYFKHVIRTQVTNSDPGHRYKLRVIQVNRLTQV